MTGRELKELRASAGLSQADLAGRMGVHALTISRWERGERPISKMAARFATVLCAGKRGKK